MLALPPLVGVGDALFTGVDTAAVFGYLAVTATAVMVAALIAMTPSAFDLREFRLGGVFVFAYLLTMLIATPSVFAEHQDESSGALFLFTVCSAFVLTTLAVAITGRRSAAQAPDREGRQGTHARVSDTSIDRVGTALALVGIVVFAAYLVTTPVIPLLEALSGSRSTELAEARERALTELGSPLVSYLFGAARDVILPAAAAVLLVQVLRRPTLRRFVRFAFIALVALTASALTIEKSPVGRLVLVLFLTTWIGRSRPLRWRTASIVIVLFVAFPFAVSRLSNSPLNSNAQIASTVGERMFRVPANVHYHYVAYVNTDLDEFLVGRTIPNLGKFAVGPSVTMTEEVQRRIFPDAVVEGGNANGSYISNFYADFGLLGVALGSLLTGLAIGLLDRMNRQVLPRALGVPMQAVTAVQLLFLTSSSLFDTIIQFPFGNLGLLAMIVVFVHLWLPLRRDVVYSGRPKAAVNAST